MARRFGNIDNRRVNQRFYPADYIPGELIPRRTPREAEIIRYQGFVEHEIIVQIKVMSENEAMLAKFTTALHFWSRGEERAAKLDTMCPRCKVRLGLRAIVKDGKEEEDPPTLKPTVYMVKIIGLNQDSLLPRRVGLTKFWSPPEIVEDTLYTQCPVELCTHNIVIKVLIRPAFVTDAYNDDEGIEEDTYERFVYF